jgi:glycosyltransferase involved in cell wall biosynthesis
VAAQSTPPLEVIVVLDHNPALLTRVRQRFPWAQVVANAGPRGLSGARNSGVDAAAGEVVVFLDDDAHAHPDWLHHLLRPFEDPSVVGVGGTVTGEWEGGRPKWFPPEFDWVVGCSYRGGPNTRMPIRNPLGASMGVRRQAYESVGGCRTDLGRLGKVPLGCEETELSIRVAQEFPGSHFVHEPEAEVYHHVPAERARWRYFRSRTYAEGLSKAVVVRSAGSASGLAAERAHALRTLPVGLWRGVIDSLRGDLTGLLRSSAIVAGLFLAAWGYLVGRLRRGRVKSQPRDELLSFVPMWIGEVELGRTEGDVLPGRRPDGAPYERARLLVRLHGDPLGTVDVAVEGGRIDGSGLNNAVTAQLGNRISDHLADDGLADVTLNGEWPDLANPPCRLHDVGDTSPLISVVIPTRDRADQVVPCVESLLKQTYSNFEVLVVDNAPSTTDTVRTIEERFASDPRVRYVLEPRPGVSRARNAGVRNVRGSIVAFIDDDGRADPDWLYALLSGFAAGSDVACVTGLILPQGLDTRFEQLFEETVDWSAKSGLDRTVYDLGENRADSPLFPFDAGRFGSGGNAAFRADFIKRIGGYDPALGAGSRTRGGEDLDIYLRTVLGGRQLAIEPRAVIWHNHRATLEELESQMYGYGSGLAAYLFKCLLRPRTGASMIRKAPQGLVHLVRPWIRADSGGGATPASVKVAYWRGFIAGPVAYLRGRLEAKYAERGPGTGG